MVDQKGSAAAVDFGVRDQSIVDRVGRADLVVARVFGDVDKVRIAGAGVRPFARVLLVGVCSANAVLLNAVPP